MVQGMEGSDPGGRAGDSRDDLGPRLLADQVRLLFRSPVALVVNLVNAAIVSIVLWPAVDGPWVALWAGALTVTVAARFLLRRFYRAAASHDARYWARLYAVGAGATGLLGAAWRLS